MNASRDTTDGEHDGHARSRVAALRAVLAIGVSVFAIDLWLPSSLVLGSLLILPVLASAWLQSPRFTNVVTVACAFAGIFGAVIGLGGGATSPPTTVALQMACSLFVILVSGQLALMRIRSEVRLDRSRELVATALRSIADAVVTTDRNDLVTLVNGPAQQLLGADAAAARGRPLDRVVRLERDPQTMTPADPRAPRRRLLVVTQGGQEIRRPVEVTSSPIVGVRGEDFGRVLVLRDASDVVAFEERMRELAYRDGLTGLANRRSLEERLDLELKHARRARARLGVLFLDLDKFKAINDTYGHRAGDQLLVAVGERLSAALREADTVARISGDEFCVLVPEVGSREDLGVVANKLLDAVVRPVVLEGVAVPISPSIGAALYPDDAGSADELLSCADAAMYRAKGLGGAGWAVHDGATQRWSPAAHVAVEDPRRRPDDGRSSANDVPAAQRTPAPDLGATTGRSMDSGARNDR
jgi:diguanylate cyclase (GGDEF)-like protein/PAS domain S-box-containing protein